MRIEDMPWHVLQVRSNCERRIAQLLAARAVESYVPLYRERVRWSDRTVVTERPLFAGYVFARFLLDCKIRVICTLGVVRSLGDEERDLVSHTELDTIRQALASGHMLRPHCGVSKGARVRVRCGPFEGYEGIVEELRQNCTLVLSLTAVQRSFSLQVALEDIEVLRNSLNKVESPVYAAAHCAVL